jgi:hypothetical protein
MASFYACMHAICTISARAYAQFLALASQGAISAVSGIRAESRATAAESDPERLALNADGVLVRVRHPPGHPWHNPLWADATTVARVHPEHRLGSHFLDEDEPVASFIATESDNSSIPAWRRIRISSGAIEAHTSLQHRLGSTMIPPTSQARSILQSPSVR